MVTVEITSRKSSFGCEYFTATYDNGVKITFEYFENTDTGKKDIYLTSIVSDVPNMGHGTEALKSFLEEFRDSDLYLFMGGSETCLDVGILKKWYSGLGFVSTTNQYHIGAYKCNMVSKNKNSNK